MKTSQLAAVSAAFIAVGTLVSPRALAQTTPTIPVGNLTAYPTVVQTGTKPKLTWDISYPSIVQNFVTITQPGTVTPKQNLVCDVRILGLGVTSMSNNVITYYRTRGQWKYNGSSSWADIYDGKQTDTIVQQQGIVKSNIAVTKDKAMNFAGQYYNSSWQTQYTSTSGLPYNVRALVSGDVCPNNIPDYNAPSLESFLKPYLDSAHKVKIGPMDVIIIMELTHTDTTNIGYDLQDLVMLITFRKP
ncbi:MAG: hypothetical protein ABIS50_14375 [Luteolibacter sp.]|uniref:hypothetical protein n=1 Tax=Luteolibacter sp. TaxID=1962973 RepID=UPI0032671C3A